MSILVKNLTKMYGAQAAVDNISFEVKKGEIVGFLGPNGAGKSTTMKMITGYLHPDAGNIEVCGIPVVGESIATRKKIGYLPEANPLYMDMYVREYLSFICGLHKVPQAPARIEEVIKLVGLSPEAHKKLGQLSKGYKQRAGLAAALVHNPEVLILDEPTSGLDPNQIQEIRSVIKSLAAEKTILLSSHIMQEVEAVCSRVVIINKGKIVADDNLAHLRSLSSTQSLVVNFSHPVSMADLQNLEGAGRVTTLGTQEFEIATEAPETLRRSLMQYSLNKDISINSMQNRGSSLEEIFGSLTKK